MMINDHFALTHNAFYLLQSTPEDNLDTLTEKHEDALFDAIHSEQVINQAYHALCTSLPRLKAEVSSFIGVQASVFNALMKDPSVEISDEFPTLTKINLIAQCFNQNVSEVLLSQWVKYWESISIDQTLTLINKQRQISKFPQVNLEQLEPILAELRTAQINALIYDFESYERHRNWLASELKRDFDQPLISSSILVELVNVCKSISISRQELVKENTVELVKKLFENQDDEQQDAIEKEIELTLKTWLDNSYVLSLADARRGLQTQKNTYEFLQQIIFLVNNWVDTQVQTALMLKKAWFVLTALEKYVCIHEDVKNAIQMHINRLRNDYWYYLREERFASILDFKKKIIKCKNSFFAQVMAGYFQADTKTICLASDLYKEIVMLLESYPNEDDRTVIFYAIENVLFSLTDSYEHTAYGILKWITLLQELRVKYPVRKEEVKPLDDIFEWAIFEAVQGYIHWCCQSTPQRVDELNQFIPFAVAHTPSHCRKILARLKDVQKDFAQFFPRNPNAKKNGIFYAILVIFIIFLRLMSKR